MIGDRFWGLFTTPFGKGSGELFADPTSNQPGDLPGLDRHNRKSDGCQAGVASVSRDEGVDNIRRGFRGVIDIKNGPNGQECREEDDEKENVQGRFD